MMYYKINLPDGKCIEIDEIVDASVSHEYYMTGRERIKLGATVIEDKCFIIDDEIVVDGRNLNCFRGECDLQDQESCDYCASGDSYQEGYTATSVYRWLTPAEKAKLKSTLEAASFAWDQTA